MKKIQRLLDISQDNSLKLSEKLEKVHNDRLELSIMFLLLDREDDFEKLFPLKEITQNFSILNEYSHQTINSKIYHKLITSDDFVLDILQKPELFESFNDITDNGLIKRLNESLDREPEFVKKMVDLNLLDLYIKYSIFSNGFFNCDLDAEYTKKILDFIKKHPEQFTEAYLDSLDNISNSFKEYFAQMVFSSYNEDKDFYGFYQKYLQNNKELYQSQIIQQLKPSQLLQILNNETMFNNLMCDKNRYNFNEPSSSDNDYYSSLILDNLDLFIDDNLNKSIIEKLKICFNDKNLLYQTIISKIGVRKLHACYEENSDGLPNFVVDLMDIEYIKSGDYSEINDIDNLNEVELSNEELIEACIAYTKKSSYFSIYRIEDINKFEDIKLGLAKRLLSEKIVDDIDELKEFDLDESFYVEHFGLEKYIKISIGNDENLQGLFQKYPNEVKKACLDYIEKNEYYYGKREKIEKYIEQGIFNSSDIIYFFEKDIISLESDLIPLLSEEDFKKIINLKRISKIDLLVSPFLNETLKNKIISKLEESQITSSSRLKWINLSLTSEQIQSIWDKVKEKGNRDLKDLMFDLISYKSKEMSAELFSEIKARACKLKGYEDIRMNSADDGDDSDVLEDTINVDPKLLAKKFTKDITSPKNAYKALFDETYTTILDNKNLMRIFKKVSTESDLVEKIVEKIKNGDLIGFDLNLELLSSLITENNITDKILGNILLSNKISDEHKIHFVKIKGKESYHHNSFYFNEKLENISLNIIVAILEQGNRHDRFLNLLSNEQKMQVAKNNSWTKICVLQDNDFFETLNFELRDEIFKSASKLLDKVTFDSIIEKSLSSDCITEDNLKLCLKHSPNNLETFFSRRNSLEISPLLFREVCLTVENIEFLSLESILKNKQAFSFQELKLVFNKVSQNQIKDAFEKSYNAIEILELMKELSSEELNELFNDKNLPHIPAQYWEAYNILDKSMVTDEEWSNFFGSKNIVAKLAILSREEKLGLLKKLNESEIDLDLVKTLYSLQDILGYETSQIEGLIFKLNGPNMSYLFANFSKYADLFKNFSEESKFKLLEIVIKEGKDLGNMDKVFALLPSSHPLRIQLINKAHIADDIEDILKNTLTDEESLIIAERIALNKIKINLYYLTDSNAKKAIINSCITHDFFTKSEEYNDNGDKNLKIYILSSEVATFGSHKRIVNGVTEINQIKLQNIYQNLEKEYPSVIKGTFLLEEKLFKPNESNLFLENELLNSELDSKMGDDKDLIFAIGKFSGLKSVNAIAKRHLGYRRDVNYIIELLIDDTILKSKDNNYDKELLSLLENREQSIKEMLEDQLMINDERTFGFELEFSANRTKDHIAKALRNNKKNQHGISIKEEYVSSNGRTWDFKIDGSVNATNGYAIELASPILHGNHGIEESREILNYIFENYKVDTSRNVNGGLHVHHDIKDLKKLSSKNNEILKHFMVFQESLYSLCDSWRQSNSYCSKIQFTQIEEDREIKRTVGFNISPYGTMEFRMRESMNDTDSIMRWILLTQKVVESAAIGLKQQSQEFKKVAGETLELLQKEKALQLKKLENSGKLMEEIQKYNQARMFSEMVLQNS